MIVAAALVAGGAALAGPANAVSHPASKPAMLQVPQSCPSACPAVFQPVTCLLSDGTIRAFSNRCHAELYACRRGVKVIACAASLD